MSTKTIAVPARSKMTGRPASRVLVVSDGTRYAKSLLAEFENASIEITHITKTDQIPSICCDVHDIVVIDLEPGELLGALQQLRKSTRYDDISILVDNSRLNLDASLAGVLPQFRAMPCNPVDLVRLVRRQILSPNYQPDARPHYVNRML